MKSSVLGTFLALGLTLGVSAHPWQGFSSLALAPDSRTFATGGRGGEVRLWETSTGESVEVWKSPGTTAVVGLSFAPDGTLGAGFLDGTLVLFVLDHPPSVPSPAVDPPWRKLSWADGQWTATGAHRQWSFVPRGGNPGEARPGVPVVPPDSVVPLSRSEAGDLWAQGTFDGQIEVGSRTEGRTLTAWKAHDSAVTGLALSPDGSFLLSCSYDGSLAKWDPRTGRLLGRL